ACADATLVRFAGNGRDVITDFFRLQWIADIEGAHAGVKVSDKQHSSVINRREVFVGGMRAKAPAPAAEISARFRNCPGRDSKGFRFGGDVEHPNHLTVLETFICGCLADSDDEITRRLSSLWCSLIVVMLDAGGGSGARTQFLFTKFAELHAE